jgi:hypothetical protein
MIFAVFYVASFVSLAIQLQVVHLEGLVLEVANYKACIRDSFFNVLMKNDYLNSVINKGNNKITELRTIFQRETQNSYVYKQTKSDNNRKTVKTQ